MSESMTMLAEVWDRPLSLDAAITAVAHPSAGGIATFVGVVRDHNDGRAVVKLEYQAYGSMAAAEMRRIMDEIAAELPGTRLAAVHRTGELGVGDLAIVCAASAPHRDEAFRACKLLIDRIKERVPVWKREHGPEGAYWVGWEDARCSPDHGTHEHGAHAHGHDHHGAHGHGPKR